MKPFLVLSFLVLFGFSGCADRAPAVVSHDFIDLSQIDRISKFRSGYGHDFSYLGDEECRSMKHYFKVKDGIDPRTVTYFAPVGGTIKDVRGQQFFIDDKNSDRVFVFFHVDLASGLQQGSRVKAGQVIGRIGDPQAHGEIAIEDRRSDRLVSWFEVMDPALEAKYEAFGATRENMIISERERDQTPLNCDANTPDGRFIPSGQSLNAFQEWQESEANWVTLK